MTIDRVRAVRGTGDGKVRPGERRVPPCEITWPKATAPIKVGGAGADVYNFTGSYGGDWVVDSDGQGSIKVDGLTLAGGKKLSPGYYKDADTGWTYALSSGALVLRKDGSLNQITVRGWQPGQLGITLDDTAVVPVTTTSYSGDFKKKITDTYYAYFNNNYVQDGTLLEANAQDIITGSSLADKMQGLGGNDALFGAAGDDVIEGGDGDDLLLGGMGQDTLSGGAGRDFIYGSAAGGLDHPLRTTDAPPVAPGPEYTRGLGWVTYDSGIDANGIKTYGIVGGGGLSTLSGDATSLIDGGAGDDWIRAGSGSDVVHGGDDKDDIMGMAGNDVLFGDAGDDRVYGDGIDLLGYVETVPGTQHGNDILDGGAGNDELTGQGGDDELYGGIGDDKIWGDDTEPKSTPSVNHGRDYLDGGDGADQLEGGGLDDTLYGGLGNDILVGDGDTKYLGGAFHGDDYLDGGDGNDSLRGDGGNDTLYGGAGVDVLWGDADATKLGAAFHGADYLDGEDGDDSLVGGGKADTLFGGIGNDTLFGDGDAATLDSAAHGNDYLDGEDGDDYMQGDGGSDTLIGGAGKDTLLGDADKAGLALSANGDDYLEGDAGDDALVGGGGADTLYGGDDNDSLRGDNMTSIVAASAHGNDLLDGGAGIDRLYGDGGNDTLIGGDGADWLAGEDEESTTAVSQLTGDDTLSGGAGDDTLVGGNGLDSLDGGEGNDGLYGGADADTLNGGDGWDYLDGGSGVDALDGGVGNDTLYGGGGNDTLSGGDGNDWLSGDDDVSTDAVSQLTGDDSLSGGAGVDTLVGGNGADLLDGGEGDDGLYGGADADKLVGAAGADYLDGGRGNDSLYGGDGADTLYGGLGDDTLVGGAGVDRLFGGGGNDTYVLDANDLPLVNGAAETVYDIEGTNTIRLTGGAPTSVSFNGTTGALLLRFGPDYAVVLQDAMRGGVSRVNTGLADISFSSWLQGKLTTSVALNTTAQDQTLFGGSANDSLSSALSGARFEGGRGNDTLMGSGGNNTYVVGLGGGTDRIVDTSAKTDALGRPTPNRVLFGAGITAADLKLTQDGALVVQVGSGGDAVRIDGFTAGNALVATAIDSFVFVDNTTLTYAQLLARGFDYAGTAAADVITGTNLVDRFASSAGNDRMQGGLGSDTYAWGLGSGQDVLDDTDTALVSTDTLTVAAGLTPLSVVLNRQGNDLIVRAANGSDQITIVNHYAGAGIERMVFDGGVTWTAADIAARVSNELTNGADNFYGTAGADFVDAKAGDDIVHGLAGDDTIDGGSGLDTLFGGDGNDSLLGNDGADQLLGEAGDDSLNGGAGEDTLDGGAGNDTLKEGEKMYGGSGSDTYVIGAGTNSFVYEYADAQFNLDALLLPSGSTPLSVQLYRWFNSGSGWYDDLVVKDTQSNASVYLQGYYLTQNNDGKVEEIRLGNTSVWTVQDVMAKDRDYQFTETADYILGRRWADVIDARGGNDSIYSGPGDDSVFGGAGNDSIDGGGGNDLLDAGTGDDAVFGSSGNDTLNGGAGNDMLNGGGDDDILEGAAGDDRLFGDAGNDTYLFNRGDGNDEVSNFGGTDRVVLGGGIGAANVTLFREDWDLIIAIDQGAMQIRVSGHYADANRAIANIQFTGGPVWDAAAIAARVVSGSPNAMVGTAGDDTFVVDNAGDTITEGVNQGIDTVQSSIGFKLGANLENLTLTGYLGVTGQGNDLDNVINGNTGANSLYGGLGADTINGGAGDDWLSANRDRISADDAKVDRLYGGSGNDRYSAAAYDIVVEQVGEGVDTVDLWADAFTYTLPDNVENLNIVGVWNTRVRLNGNSGNNLISVTPNDGSFDLDGGTGADTLIGNQFGGTYWVDNIGDVVKAGSGTDTVKTSVDWTLSANEENLELLGTAVLRGTGNGVNNVLRGNAAGSSLYGLGGNDSLYGFGTNTLVGGTGDDTYYTGTAGVAIQELAGEGTDTVVVGDYVSVDHYNYQLSTFANVENMELSTYSNNANIVGTSGDNTLVGNAYENRLEGGAGNDLMYDHYNFAFNGIDNDFLLGGDGNDSLFSVSGADVLDGGSGDDLLSGSGDVTIAFGRGYGVDRWTAQGAGANRRVLFNADVSLDDVRVARAGADLQLRVGALDVLTITGFFIDSVSLTTNGLLGSVQFADGTTLDESALMTRLLSNNSNASTQANDVLLGSPGADSFSGLGGNDLIFGADGDDILSGDAGNDVLQGGQGNDTYRFALGDGQDVITETGGASDAVLLAAGIAPADVKVSRSGVDLLIAVGQASDRMTVRGFFTSAAAKVDSLRFNDGTVWGAATLLSLATTQIGTAGPDTIIGFDSDDRLFGLAGDDSLYGYAGNDLLDGGSGNDNMSGGIGDDTYVVDSLSDVTTEYAFQGMDTVQSAVTWTLNAELENLTLTGGAAINGTGNLLSNVLTGNGAANTLNGGAGADTLVGGGGNDIYVVDNAADSTLENLNEGSDTVQSTITWTLAPNIENLTLTGSSAINGTGNTLDNMIAGNGANNTLMGGLGNDTLDGGLGNDTLIGGAGDDTYRVNISSDVVTELAAEGTDSVESSVTWTLGTNVENLTLTGTANINGTANVLNNTLRGNAGNNVLTGGAGFDTLDGGAGIDTLVGGADQDGYLVDDIGDVVTESFNEGLDYVLSSVSYSLSANVEYLVLNQGASSALNATGNVLDNALIGNEFNNVLNGLAGNDYLSGGIGNDTMVGGSGDDIYVVDSAGDVVTEALNEGIDLVQVSVAWTLGANVENLMLIGTAAIDGTGNALNNTLIGNAAANVLTGAAGNDTLDGGAGADTLIGGTGADIYAFNAGHGIDIIQENDATLNVKDAVQFLGTIKQADVQFRQAGNNLEVLLTASLDKLVMQNWYLGSQYHVEEFRFSDGNVLLDTQVQLLVSAMAGFNVPTAGIESSPLHRPMHNHMISAHMLSPPMTA